MLQTEVVFIQHIPKHPFLMAQGELRLTFLSHGIFKKNRKECTISIDVDFKCLKVSPRLVLFSILSF